MMNEDSLDNIIGQNFKNGRYTALRKFKKDDPSKIYIVLDNTDTDQYE